MEEPTVQPSCLQQSLQKWEHTLREKWTTSKSTLLFLLLRRQDQPLSTCSNWIYETDPCILPPVYESSMKWFGWRSAPPSQSPWFSTGKQWIAPSGWELSSCPKLGFKYIRVLLMSEGKVRWTAGLVQHQQYCRHCAWPLWWRKDRAGSFQFISQSVSLHFNPHLWS